MISLCHATHNRPKLMHECREAWLALAKVPDGVEHIFAFGTAGWKLYQHTIAESISRPSVVIGEPSTSVGGWNRAYEASHGGIVVQLSDDMMPSQDWDELIREAIGDVTKPRVLGCAPDSPAGAQGGLLTLAVCTRAYIEQKGYFIYPEYHGVYEDNDFTQAAILDDVLVDTYDALQVRHDWGGHDGDATYRRQNSKHGWFVGQHVYEARKRACFPAIAYDSPCALNARGVYGGVAAECELDLHMLHATRAFRDCMDIRNLPFERDSYRDLFLRGEWAGAIEGAQKLTEKYGKYNHGEMNLDSLQFISEWSTTKQGDPNGV